MQIIIFKNNIISKATPQFLKRTKLVKQSEKVLVAGPRHTGAFPVYT